MILRRERSSKDFVLDAHAEMLTLSARSDRACFPLATLPEAKQSRGKIERILLNRERAREVVNQLKFEGLGIKGDEVTWPTARRTRGRVPQSTCSAGRIRHCLDHPGVGGSCG